MTTLSPDPGTLRRLLDDAHDRLPAMLADIERLVRVESPSADLAAVAAGAEAVAAVLLDRLGARPEVLERDGVTHLRLRLGVESGAGAPPRVVLLCHQDTVWPIGTLDRLPFEHADGILRGPGSFDMLTGLVMAIHAIAAVRSVAGDGAVADVCLLVTGDEETGSVTSRSLILDEAVAAAAVLVPEASADSGALKVVRKGVALYQVEARGRAAHAGLEPEAGINAGLELAAQLPVVAGLGDASAGTTVTPTTLSGGTTTNTVPARARVDVDARASSAAELDRVDRAIRALTPVLPGAEVVVTGGLNRPPLERPASEQLYARYAALATTLGLPVPDGVAVGGGSDGNFTGGAGIPTLDGLGAVGGGAHADHEHVVVAEIAPRTALLAGMVLSAR
ncbi:MAG: M20/M25/M40 family metallo-hydrolase [Jiangellaceae bacterium]